MFSDLEDNFDAVPTKADNRERFPCMKCGGTGVVTFGYVNIQQGKCFACKGKGYFLTSPHQRKKAKDSRVARQEKQASAKLESFKAEQPAAYDWLSSSSSDFAASLLMSVSKYGSLTERQLQAVFKCIAKDEERAKPQQPAGNLDLSDLRERFELAKAAGKKTPKINLGDVVFSMAGDRSKNPGMIYVKGGSEWEAPYYGKVDQQGNFFPSRDADDQVKARILELAKDVVKAAKVYGKQEGQCCFCNRELNTNESVANGYGPVCADKFGLPWEVTEEFMAAKAALKEANSNG